MISNCSKQVGTPPTSPGDTTSAPSETAPGAAGKAKDDEKSKQAEGIVHWKKSVNIYPRSAGKDERFNLRWLLLAPGQEFESGQRKVCRDRLPAILP